ncbi:MAG TPA: hypothetical protein VMM18_05910 [Gemmatimonadaceae bacterium]|nr:hypothetical protein [Gemmatimonadaceae bacterium]
MVAICDVTDAPDADCGAAVDGATPAVRSFTVSSDPPITVDADKYKVDWDTQEGNFVAGRTFRVHVFARRRHLRLIGSEGDAPRRLHVHGGGRGRAW